MPQTPLIIIQARLNSSRLPGKVLMPIKGKPMLQYLLERMPEPPGHVGDCQRTSVYGQGWVVVVCPAGDTALIDHMRYVSWPARNWNKVWEVDGPEDDVAFRFASYLGAEYWEKLVGRPCPWRDESPRYETFIRLCGDSPLMDPALIDAAIALYEPPYLEIRSPVGSVEVCDTAEFLAGLPMMTQHEREHVTLRLRPAGKTIRVGNGQRLVVDTREDFDRVAAVIEKMDRPHTEYGWREVCELR